MKRKKKKKDGPLSWVYVSEIFFSERGSDNHNDKCDIKIEI